LVDCIFDRAISTVSWKVWLLCKGEIVISKYRGETIHVWNISGLQILFNLYCPIFLVTKGLMFFTISETKDNQSTLPSHFIVYLLKPFLHIYYQNCVNYI
jgi:hypothetical protein